MKDTRILTTTEVCLLVRYSRRHLYRLVRSGGFPPPIQLGPKKIGWIEAELLEWLNSRPRRHSYIQHKTPGVAHV